MATTDWIDKTEILSPKLLIVSPVMGESVANGCDLKAQRKLIGESPLTAEHWTTTKSPALRASSSPKENGAICGATGTGIQAD